MKIFKCKDCHREMIPNPKHAEYEYMMAVNTKNLFVCTLPDCTNSFYHYDNEEFWFLDYNEYMQRQSIEAWK